MHRKQSICGFFGKIHIVSTYMHRHTILTVIGHTYIPSKIQKAQGIVV